MVDIFVLGIAMIGVAMILSWLCSMYISLTILIKSIFEGEFGWFVVGLFFMLLVGGIGLFFAGLLI